MANILIYIELSDNKATPASLFALNRGRDLATELGATLYALLPCATTPTYDDEDIIAVLSRHGADKVILVHHPDLGPPALFVTHGEALVDACHQFPPRLLIFPSSAEARDLAPRLAMALHADYIPHADLEHEGDEFWVTRQVFRRRYQLRQPLLAADHAMVISLCPMQEPQTLGDDEAEVAVVQATVKPSRQVRIRHIEHTVAGPVVGGGGGMSRTGDDDLQRLARVLGGSRVASTTVCDSGHAPAELCASLDGMLVDSDHYLALGISGSERHMAAVQPHTEVVAVNNDPLAPIFTVAQYGLVADATDTARELAGRLKRSEGGDR